MELSFYGTIKSSVNYFFKNPILIIPTILISILLGIISYLFNKIYFLYNFVSLNSIYSYIWLGVFVLLSITIISYLFSITIYLSGEIIKNKKYSIKQAIVISKKLWFRNFVLVLGLSIFIWGVFYLSGYLFIIIAKYLSLSLNQFKFTLTAIYIIEILGIFIFLTLSNFYLILFNLKISESIIRSIRKVKNLYHYIFLLTVIYFAINLLFSNLFSKLPYSYLYLEAINALLLVPCVCLILSIFTLANEK